MLYILSLEDDSRNHVKFVTLCKVRQSFHRLSNSTFLLDVLKYDIHAHPSDFVTHVIRMNNVHNINLTMFNVPKLEMYE
jgi:hypothetical protein